MRPHARSDPQDDSGYDDLTQLGRYRRRGLRLARRRHLNEGERRLTRGARPGSRRGRPHLRFTSPAAAVRCLRSRAGNPSLKASSTSKDGLRARLLDNGVRR